MVRYMWMCSSCIRSRSDPGGSVQLLRSRSARTHCHLHKLTTSVRAVCGMHRAWHGSCSDAVCQGATWTPKVSTARKPRVAVRAL